MTSSPDKPFSPEMKLLISAIRVDGSQNTVEIGPGNHVLSLAMGLATQHGVFPLFYKFLKEHEREIPAGNVIQDHKLSYLGNVGRNMQLTQRLLNILDLLSGNGVRAIPFKGPVIAVQAYGDIGLRSFCDLDMLIRPEDFFRVYDLMESTEYRSIKPMIARVKGLWRKTRRSFEFQGENFFVDFHQQVAQGPWFLDLKIEWDNLSRVELNGRKVPCMNLEDTILMLAMHGTHHGWELLKYVADFAHMVSRQKHEIDWEKLVRKAGGMGVLRMVLIGMLLGRTFCGLTIPERIEELVAGDGKLAKLVTHFKGQVLETRKSSLIPQTALPRCLASRRFQFRYLAYYLFNPTNMDVLAVRLPMFLYPLYFIIRPVRLLVNLAKGRKLS